MTRRIACLALSSLAIALLSAPPALAKPDKAATARPAAQEILGRLKREHPRLLIDAEGMKQLKRRIEIEPALREMDKQLVRKAEKMLAAPLPKHVLPDGLRLLSTSQTMVDRCYTHAIVFRLHGDRRCVERLWRDLEAVAAFPDFNPKHFLDTAEMTHALAIAYDWLYDQWSESQRATLRRAIVELGLKPGLVCYRGKGWWPQCNHNWNQVCNGGLTMGALALGDEEPELAGKILEAAVASLPRAMASYAPDGAYPEGPGYWNYGTSYNVTMLAALDAALGTDFGLSGAKGFEQTALFPLYAAGPTGRMFNFADSKDQMGHAACLYWLGRRYDQPAACWFADQLKGASAQMLLWRAMPGKDPAAAKLPLDRYWRHVEVATMRSEWNDPRALFVGIQAGSNTFNHNHLDLGSFVLDALGQRWVVDLAGDNYNLPGYFGGKRYDYYRLRAEGHNTLALNPGKGPDQDPKATARVVRFESRPERAFAIAQLTPAYAKNAGRVERGIAMIDRRAVLVQDEVEARDADLWWFMHTPAKVAAAADGKTAVLSLGGEELQVRLLSPAEAKFEVGPAAPLPGSPNPPGQKVNEGIQRLAIHLPKVRQVRIAVELAPVWAKGDKAPEAKVQPLAEW